MVNGGGEKFSHAWREKKKNGMAREKKKNRHLDRAYDCHVEGIRYVNNAWGRRKFDFSITCSNTYS